MLVVSFTKMIITILSSQTYDIFSKTTWEKQNKSRSKKKLYMPLMEFPKNLRNVMENTPHFTLNW